ncbi:MAG: aminotransferase class V-fold PLP-dependent enzyme [Limisphaerales bacterium]
MNASTLDKSGLNFPIRATGVNLSHCGVSPLYPGAAAAARQWDEAHMRLGAGVFRQLPDPTTAVHRAAAALLDVPETDLSFLRNTAEGLSMVANGLPLAPGERIVSYVHEYPSNHYPWRLQEARGAKLELLPDRDCGSGLPAGRPRGFELADLERLLRVGGVRAVALSHVQFTSGFVADLPAIGRLCREHGAWLIVDAAQSLGVLTLRPREWGVDAIAASGWKWLMGPIGTGLLYTSARLRGELRCTMAGADLMEQGEDYLNHTWRPHADGQVFEYGTASMAPAAALAACIGELQLRHGPTVIAAEAGRLRELLIAGLDPARFRRAHFPGVDGPILSWDVAQPEDTVRRAAEAGITVTVRGGYLRTAPHFYNTDDEIHRAIEILNHGARAG